MEMVTSAESRRLQTRRIDLISLLSDQDKAREQHRMFRVSIVSASVGVVLAYAGIMQLRDSAAVGLISLSGGLLVVAAGIVMALMRLGLIKNERTGADFDPFMIDMVPVARISEGPWLWDESTLGGRYLRGWKLLQGEPGVLLAAWNESWRKARILVDGHRYYAHRTNSDLAIHSYQTGALIVEKRQRLITMFDGTEYIWKSRHGPLDSFGNPVFEFSTDHRRTDFISQDSSISVNVTGNIPDQHLTGLLMISMIELVTTQATSLGT